MDLGVGRRVKTGEANTIAGTPVYRPPEMGVLGYDNKVDIYALGITIYELITGALPFKKNICVDNTDVKKDIEMRLNDSLDFSLPQWQNYSQQLK